MSFKLSLTCLAVGSKEQIFSTKYPSTYCEQKTKLMGSSASETIVLNSLV